MRGRSRLVRPARSLLRLYPQAWRERYGDELSDVLGQHRVTPFTLLDLLVGAVDAHRHPELLPTEVLSMSTRLRSSLVLILIASVVFAMGWAMVLSVRDPLPPWLAATAVHPALYLAISAVQLTGLVVLLAIAAGGLPLLGSSLWRAARAPGSAVFVPMAVAGLAFLAFVGLTVAAVAGWLRPLSDTIGSGIASLVWGAAVLASIVVGVVALARAVWLAEPHPGAVAWAMGLGRIAVIAMALGVLSTLALLIAVAWQAPEIGAPVAALVPMAAASGLAAVAVGRGLRGGPTAAR